MSNKDLLKQAIAEAKTIREAAIANAKEALEETLTPHLKDMLAAKLQEMEEKEDEEVMDENIYEAEEEEVDAEEGEEGAEEEEAGEEGEEGEEEELEIEDMSVEDLKDLIRDIVAQETGNEGEAEMEAGEEGPEGQDDMVSMDDSEEIDINELLAELEGMDDEVEEGIADTAKNVANKVGKGLEKGIDYVGNKLHGGKGLGLSKGETVNEEDLDESIVGDVAATLDTTMQQAEFVIGVLGSLGVLGASAIMSKVHDMAEKGTFGQKAQAAAKGLSKAGSAAASARNVSEESEDLQEALKAVKILRNQLQEVNLLNAKLLYVNKVFKSNNLSEGQKVNVIAAFDKAETVKEVKLVFETVSKNVVAKPAAIKEHRSFASKATGNAQTTAPKEIISEVSEQVQRWQKLAGIIKS